MPTTPPSITAAGSIPDPSDRGTYNARAYAFMTWMKNAVSEFNAVVANVFANSQEAYNSAATANAAAASAASSAGAVAFNAVTVYAQYDNAISPIDYQTYRRKTAGSSPTDPSIDVTNWVRLTGIPRSVKAMSALAFLNQ